jgi:hypothetical protein
VIEELICEILGFIMKRDRVYLFDKIYELKISKEIQKKNSELKFIGFLKKFTIKCLNQEIEEKYNNTNNTNYTYLKDSSESKEVNFFGLELIWDILMENNDTYNTFRYNAKNINIIFNAFIEILESISNTLIKETYLEKCLRNIVENQVKIDLCLDSQCTPKP